MSVKTAFVPDSVTSLEQKAAPAPVVIGGVFYPHPAPLTMNVYQNSVGGVINSFNNFRTNGDYGRLFSNLNRSITNLPYHHRIGMNNQLLGIVVNLHNTLVTTRGNYFATQAAITNASQAAVQAINHDILTLYQGGAIFIR